MGLAMEIQARVLGIEVIYIDVIIRNDWIQGEDNLEKQEIHFKKLFGLSKLQK